MANRYCPQCGSLIEGDDRFCPSCGAALAEQTARRPVATKRSDTPRQLFSPWVLGAIVLAGLLMLAAGLLLQPDEVAEDVPPTAAPDIPFPTIARTDLQEARDRVQTGQATFVDVRGAEDYATLHIPGALSIPLGASEMDPAYEDLPVSAEIITYCT